MLEHEIAGLHVREAGRGALVVLVHAFPVDSRMYAYQLTTPFGGYRLVAPDLPGFGGTPPGDVSSMDDYADALLRLLDAEHAQQCVLLGTSMGGYVAFALYRAARERVAALALVDTRPGSDTDEQKEARERNAVRVSNEGPGPLAEELLPSLLAASTRNTSPDVAERVRRMAAEADPHGIAAALRAMAVRPDATDLLEDIEVPTLIVVGAEDEITPPPQAEEMHRRIRGSELVTIQGAAHLPPIEAADAFNDALRDFLQDLEVSPPAAP